MGNYLLYEDDNIKIELDKNFHNYMKATHVRTMSVPRSLNNLLLSFILTDMKAKGIEKGKRHFLFCSNCPIIDYEKGIGLSEPFDVFDAGLNFLAMQESLEENPQLIEEAIQEMYWGQQEKKLYCKIFDAPVQMIRGYFLYETDDEIIILFWGYDNYRDDDEENLLEEN